MDALAVFRCQSVLDGLARQAPGVNVENSLVDRRVAPPTNPMIHTEYADKFESYAYEKKTEADAASGVEAKLNNAGLPIHIVGVACGEDSLGWHFSPTEPILGVSPRGVWRLRVGLLEFARRGYGTAHQLENPVGHFTSRALLRRELLAVFGTFYIFKAKYRHASTKSLAL